MIAHIKALKFIYTRNHLLDIYQLSDLLLLVAYELPQVLGDNELSELLQ